MRYHYTVGVRLASILRDGYIRQATVGVPVTERPIVWFTRSEAWEETANKMVTNGQAFRTLTREETARACGGLYRVAVADTYPLLPFLRLVRRARQDPRFTEALLVTARRVGSEPVRDWYGTFDRVGSVDWQRVERCTPSGWEPMLIPGQCY